MGKKYGIAAVAVAVAAAIRFALDPWIGGNAPLVLFAVAVMVAARYGGPGPGFAATAASLLIGWWFFIAPNRGLTLGQPAGAVNLVLFALVGVGITLLNSHLRRLHLSTTRSEERFRLLSETLPQLVWTCTADGRCDYLNARWAAYTGMPAAEQMGYSWLKRVHPEDRAGLLEKWNAAVSSGAEFRAEYRIRRHDGVYRWFDGRALAFRDNTGSVGKWFGSSTDVHDTREAQEALRREGERLSKIVASAPAAICSFRLTAAGAVSMPYASPAIRDIYNLDPASLALDAAPVFEAIHPDDVTHVRASIERSAATMEPWHDEYRVRNPVKGEIWVEGRSVPTREPDESLLWYGFIADVTERKRSEQALREAEGRLQFALDASNTGYWEIDLADSTCHSSRQHGRIFGYDGPAPEWAYDKFVSHVIPEDRERLNLAAGPPGSKGIANVECRIVRTDGETRWIWTCSRPIPDRNGGPGRLVGIVQDITDRRRADEALRQQTDREVHILRTLVAEAPVSLTMFDRQMRYVQCSKRWLADYGITSEGLIGKSHYVLFPNLPDVWKEAHRRGLAGEKLSASGDHYVAPDGREHWMNWEIHPWGDEGEETGGIIIYAEDITGRKLLEDAARRQEIEYRALFQHMSEGLAYCRMIFEDGSPRDFVYLAVNEAFSALTGLKNVAGKRVSEVIPGIREADPGLLETYGRVSLTGVAEKFEVWVEALKMWFSISCYSPEREYFVTVFDVITERKREQQELSESRTRLQLALDISELGVWEYDPAAGVFTTSPRYRAIFDFDGAPTLEECMARVHPEDRARVTSWPDRSGPFGESWDYEYRIVLPGGKVRWVASRGSKMRAADPPRPMGVVKDITLQKEAEQALERSRALYHAMARSIPDAGLWVVGPDMRYLAVEGDLVARLGMTRQDLEQRRVRDTLIDPRRRAVVEERFRKALDGETEAFETEADGRTLWVRYVPIRDEAGGVAAAMALALDITSRKHAEEEVLRLNAELEDRVRRRTTQLEAANQELEAFAYSVSHDLRAPLRGIDGWSLALLDDYGSSLDERAHRYLDRVRSETQRMGRLIDDLLQLSRVSRSEMRIEALDLSALARTIAARLAEAHPARRIEYAIEPDLETSGDPRLLEIALTNLFDNALKFTASREPALIEFGRSAHSGEPCFFLRDNGVGFDMAYAGMLFGAFQRMHSVSEFPGSGIGLATVQRVIRRHGGRVWAEADVDRGATFYFNIGGAG